MLTGGLGSALAVIVLLGGHARLHAPNLALLAAEPVVIQLHVAAAVTAFLVGCGLLARRKGDALHKTLGWAWAATMMTTALSSFFIHRLNPGGYSPIHALSGWVTITVPAGVAFARRRAIGAHRRTMTLNFVGGLIIAGAFTFVPGRLMWRVFFG